MKILQINSTCGFGSTGRIAVDILNTVCENGGEGLICYGRGEAPSGVPSYKIGSETLVKIHGVLSRVTDRQGFYSTNATKALVRKIEEYGPDIIHLHNIHGYYLDIRVLFDYLKQCGKPIVWTLHDCWAFTGHCAHFTVAGCDKWKTGCNNCPSKKEYPQSLFLDNSGKNYNEKKALFTAVDNMHIITPSYWLRDTARQSFLAKYPIEAIYNGIDLEIFKKTDSDFREKYNLQDKKTVLGVANVWQENKGLGDFIKLSNVLPDEYRIVLVGLTEKQISSLPKKIIGISRTENLLQLVQIYSAADVYVNASREETMGLTTVEALACGTPAVVYNETAVPEVVDSTCGTVVKSGDIDALLNAVCSVSFSQESCRKRAELFEKNKQYNKYIGLYKDILSENRREK